MAKREGGQEIDGQLVYALRNALGMSQGKLAELVGYDSYQSIQSIESGRSKRPTRLRELAKALRTTEAYLLGETDKASRPSRMLYSLGDSTKPNNEAIPQIDLSALDPSALSRNRLAYDRALVRGYWPLPTPLLRQFGGDLRTIICVTARGDQMSPKIDNGDVVFVDLSSRDASRPGTFLVAYTTGEFAIRLVEPGFSLRTGRHQLNVSCVNPKYPPVMYPVGQINIVGRCFGCFSAL